MQSRSYLSPSFFTQNIAFFVLNESFNLKLKLRFPYRTTHLLCIQFSTLINHLCGKVYEIAACIINVTVRWGEATSRTFSPNDVLTTCKAISKGLASGFVYCSCALRQKPEIMVLTKTNNMAVEGGTVSHYYIVVIRKFIDFMSPFRHSVWFSFSVKQFPFAKLEYATYSSE